MPRTLNKTAIRFHRFNVQRDADGNIAVIVNYVVETSEGEDIAKSETKSVGGAFKASLEDGFALISNFLDAKEGLGT